MANTISISFAIRRAVANSQRTIRIASHTVPIANVPQDMTDGAGYLLLHQHKRISKTQLATIHDLGHGTYFPGPCPECAQLKQPSFSATYYDGADGRRHFSLRSPDSGADVGEIAKRVAASFNLRRDNQQCDELNTRYVVPFAGGGHARAADFDAPIGWEGE